MQNEIITVKLRREDEFSYAGTAIQDRVQFAALTEQGARSEQQDSLYVGSRGNRLFAVVCDGMGGMEGGALASRMAVEMIQNRFLSDPVDDVRQFLSDAVRDIDRAVCRLEEDGFSLQAGTTMAAVVLTGNELYWLSVGDSRIYLYRAGQLLCPVSAHNYRLILDELLKTGKINREQYEDEEARTNTDGLISYLGINGVPRMDLNARPFQTEPGDKILLCSDGLYRSVPENEILTILEQGIGTGEKTDILISSALERGGETQDNTSLILIEID